MPINVGTAGKIAFYPAAGDTIDDTSLLFYNNTNNELISGSRHSFFRSTYETRPNALLNLAQFHTTSVAMPLTFTRGRGSATAQAAAENGDHVGRLAFNATVSPGVAKTGAYLNVIIDGPVSGHAPMKMAFGLLEDDGVTSNDKLEIRRDKLVVSTDADVSGNLRVTGEVTAYFSDERLKKDITPITGALDKVLAISGYTYKSNEKAEELGVGRVDNQIGLLAQEVEAVMPELVTSSAIEGYKTVRYDKLVSVLVNAVKEQQQMIDELKNIIKTKLA